MRALSFLALIPTAVSALVSYNLTYRQVPADVRLNPDTSIAARSPAVASTTDNGFWFLYFDVGATPALSLQLDTGSGIIFINQNRYENSNVGKPGEEVIEAVGGYKPDGSGLYHFNAQTWSDTVALTGATAPITTAVYNVTWSDGSLSHDGMIGFGATTPEVANPSGKSWFENGCIAGVFTECRFGIAVSGTLGALELDGVSPLYADSLITVPSSNEWSVTGDVMIAGRTVFPSQSLLLSIGYGAISGPTPAVIQIFQELGLQINQAVDDPETTVIGYYACDNRPELAFNIGGQIFSVLASAWTGANLGNNNCTAIITGTNSNGPAWVLGQHFFQGHYVDFNVADKTMGFASL